MKLPGWEVDLGTAEVPPAAVAVLLVMLWRFLTAAIAPRKVSGGKPNALHHPLLPLNNINHDQKRANLKSVDLHKRSERLYSCGNHTSSQRAFDLDTLFIWRSCILQKNDTSRHKSRHMSTQQARNGNTDEGTKHTDTVRAGKPKSYHRQKTRAA